MPEFHSFPPKVTSETWNALLDHGLVKGASYIVRKNGSTCEAINGSTGKIDYSGASFTTVFNDVVSLLGTSGGGKIFVTKGTYSVTMLTIDHDDIDANFEPGAVLNVDDTGISSGTYTGHFANPASDSSVTGVPVILVSGASRVKVSNVYIHDTGTDRDFMRMGILVWNSKYVKISDVTADHMAGAAFPVHSGGTYDLTTPTNSTFLSEHVTFERCNVFDTRTYVTGPTVKGFGFNISYARQVKVTDCYVYDPEESSFRTHGSSQVTFENCRSELQNTYGEPWDIYRSDHILVKHCQCSNPAYPPGIYMYEYIRDIRVEDCQLLSSTGSAVIQITGISPYETSTLKNITIKGCTLNSGKITFNYVDNLLIANNYWEMDGTQWVYAIVNLTATGGCGPIRIIGNEFHHTGGHTIWMQAAASPETLIIIKDNLFEHCCDKMSNNFPVKFADGSVTKAIIKGNTFIDTQDTKTMDLGNNFAIIKDNYCDKPILASSAIILDNERS